MERTKHINAAHTPDRDEDIVGRVLNGDKNAYAIIMRRHNPRLFRIARTFLKDEDEIEDVIQEAYIKAYEQLPRFERRSSFSTWLIRIMINEALARLKHRKRFASATFGGDDHARAPHELSVDVPTKVTPMEKLMNAELKVILESGLDGLPEIYRSVFIMREIEGMSVAETSQSLDISESNVKVRLNRAKGMLRDTISASYRDADVYHFNLVRCDRIVQNVLHRIGAE